MRGSASSLLRWLLGFLIWTLIGLLFASQLYVASWNGGRPISWGEAIGWSLGDWYVWGALSIPVLALTRRFHLEGVYWRSNLAIHLGACAVTALIYLVIRAWIGQLQSRLGSAPATFSDVFGPLFAKSFFFNVLIYWVVVCVGHATDYYRQFRQRERRTLELEKSLGQAKLKTLQMQLNPHFLFNTLHAISALMHKDVKAADRMISRLSDLLRRALDSGETQEVPLSHEIDFLRRYLEIEQTRFGDRLEVQFDVPHETSALLVPNLILQPLVENAIKHGIEPHARRGRVQVVTRLDRDQLVLEVRDNGGGLKSDHIERIGVANTRDRLQQLYGDDHAFRLE